MSMGQMENFTIDQFAGATALVLGSVGGLLMIVWKSRCKCRCRIGCSDKCYLFDCTREPAPDLDSDDEKDKKDKENKKDKKDKKTLKGQLQKLQSKEPEPEPEPEQLIP